MNRSLKCQEIVKNTQYSFAVLKVTSSVLSVQIQKDFQIGLKNKKTILKIVKVFFFLYYMHIFPFSQQARRDVILFP